MTPNRQQQGVLKCRRGCAAYLFPRFGFSRVGGWWICFHSAWFPRLVWFGPLGRMCRREWSGGSPLFITCVHFILTRYEDNQAAYWSYGCAFRGIGREHDGNRQIGSGCGSFQLTCFRPWKKCRYTWDQNGFGSGFFTAPYVVVSCFEIFIFWSLVASDCSSYWNGGFMHWMPNCATLIKKQHLTESCVTPRFVYWC